MTTATTDSAWYSYTSSTQTMRSWTRVLSSFDDVPEAFRATFPRRDAAFPYTILLPEDRLSFLQKRPERLLCLYDDQVVVLEANRDQVNVTPYPFQEILYVEHGRELLHSWLTIGNRAGTSTMSFNTVTIRHFEPIFDKIRQHAANAESRHGLPGQSKPDMNAFDYLNTINYKFMNFGRQSIRVGENVLNTIYQPDRCSRTVTLFNKTLFRQYATGHLSILTERELILIRQTKHIKTKGQNIYGGIFIYIPLRQIQDLSFTTDREKSLCVMTITLADTVLLRSEFAVDNEGLAAFQEACRHLKKVTA